MDSNQLLSSAVENGLDLLEKNSSFLPYCRAVDSTGGVFIYSPASSPDDGCTELQALESVRSGVLRDLSPRGLVGAAFCRHARIRVADSVEKMAAVEVELHYRGQPAAIWYFTYRMEGDVAKVLEYFCNDAGESLFPEDGSDGSRNSGGS